MQQSFTYPNGLPFLKMHGLGNDFVIIDARAEESPLTPELARAIGERHFGVGYDQLVVLTSAGDADAAMVFWNSDGSLSNACGNATRCIAQLLMDEAGQEEITLRSGNGLLQALRGADGRISVNMGHPQLSWQDVPLAQDEDLISLPIDGSPGAAGMGNPHCVFVVDDLASVDLEAQGAAIESHPLFPEKTNVEFIQVLDRSTIRQRTFERGAGVTLACGSGACAVAVVAHRKGLTERKVRIELDGGVLDIDWRADGVWMTGATQLVFSGVLAPEFLEASL
ncbi:diaminopimelate epimerase [Amylibacter marinus]|uniref:Diaminopimelate epimerase n=1 Tax=Amylibacter marinus TaxID=1475483 RepID=A0ABQ5VVV7_9RHOB|nr:diaminopimelate epimerase [Amylibacter marinus]GLQ35309.1 diaminopimelate epimerase [Amylibacter marinus]